MVSRVLNKLNFDVRLKVNPLERKRNYVSRVFYLNDYAKELRLHPKVGDKLEKEFEETNDEIAKEQKRVGLKRTFLNFTRDYVVGDFIMDGLYITYLVFKATVLKTLAYSDAVVLFNRTSSLRRGFANIADVVPMAQENSLYIDKIRAFLDYKPKMELNVGETVPSNNAELSLKHVSFKYSEDADETLKDITLKVKPGEKIAIVGYNGAGKTTLIKLLMRLYDPTEGTITYHGKDIKDYKPCDYRRRIGVVFQDYQMYGATLLENVLMTDSKAGDYSEEAAKEALERAGFPSVYRLFHIALTHRLPPNLIRMVLTSQEERARRLPFPELFTRMRTFSSWMSQAALLIPSLNMSLIRQWNQLQRERRYSTSPTDFPLPATQTVSFFLKKAA